MLQKVMREAKVMSSQDHKTTKFTVEIQTQINNSIRVEKQILKMAYKHESQLS